LGHGRADAFAAAQAGRDEVKGVFAVHLGARGAPSGAAVVAAEEELSGREVAVGDLPDDLPGDGVDVEPVALHSDGPLAAAEALDLVGVAAEVAVLGECCQLADSCGRSRRSHVGGPP
jgi:hypothetical protein